MVEKPPPVSAWPHEYRASFHALMRLAVGAFADVLEELEHERQGRAARLPARLQAFRASLSPALQSSRRNAQGDIAPFDTSFVNFFNYKHGFLGPHRDRCLVTVVYTVVHPYYPSTGTHMPEKRLWVRHQPGEVEGMTSGVLHLKC